MKSKFEKVFPFLFILLLVVLFLSPYLFSWKIPYSGDFTGSDFTELNLPLRFVSASSIKSGEFFLLTDLLAHGFPILAEGQAGVFYPLNLLYIFLPFFLAVNVGLFLNFLFGGFFSYIYCRIIKISRQGSLLAAVSFCFSGFFIFRLKHLNMINSAIWLPLQLYLVERYFAEKRSKVKILVFLSLSFVVQFFAGHPQIFYISFISVFIYFVLRTVFENSHNLFKKSKEIILSWILVAVVFFGLSAIQLLPTFFYASMSSRSISMDYSYLSGSHYSLSSLKHFVSPYFLGNPAENTYFFDLQNVGIFWENNAYFGLIPLFFAFLAVFFCFFKKPIIRILFLMILISFFFCFGYLNPFFVVFWEIIPGFKMFRFPQRFLILNLVCFTTLAGFGFDFFWSNLKRWLKRFNFFKSQHLLINWLLPLVVIIFVAFDLFFVAYAYLGALNYKEYFLKEPESVKFLKEDNEYFRIYSFNWSDSWQRINRLGGGWQNNLTHFIAARELLPPNLNVFWNISSSQDRGHLEGGMISRELHNLFNSINQGFIKDGDDFLVSEKTLKILGMQSVKYILSFWTLKSDNLILVKEVTNDFLPPLKIYKNNYFLPSVFAVFNARQVEGKEQMLAALFDFDFNPAKEIILQATGLNNEEVFDENIKILREGSGSLVINTDFSHDGYVFFNQGFSDSWQAKLNGKKIDLLRANYAFIAVNIPSGKNEIIFKYKPFGFLVGLILTFATLFFLFLFLSLVVYKKLFCRDIISKERLNGIHLSVPPDYYEAGISRNYLQKFWHQKRFSHIISELKNLSLQGKILDIGCHSGDLTNIIQEFTNCRVYGVDISQSSIEYAKKRFKKIEFFVADLSENIDSFNGNFEMITAFDVLEHILEIDKLLIKISHLISPGGYLMIGVPNENMLFRIVWFFWLKFKGQIWEDCHVNNFDSKKIIDFNKYGFEIIKEKKIIMNMWRLVIFKKII